MSKRVLIVDDDANILESYKRFFRREYQIETALGGQAGLAALEKCDQPFAVLVSDMRMPGINGAQFLSAARKLSPDSVRMLLTGHADLDDAINAINQGHIFRFLTKPCPPAAFKAALDDGIKQYLLITSERELLDKTLKGSVKLLVDILSVAIPDAFNRSLRVRKLTRQVAARLGLKNLWEVDLAVLFSQIGCVTMPVEIVKKAYQGQPLSQSEQELFSGHMEVGSELLANIPRLQSVAEAVAYQAKGYNGEGPPEGDPRRGEDLPIISRILKVVHDYDGFVLDGKNPEAAIDLLWKRKHLYDPKVLSALEALNFDAEGDYVVREVTAAEIKTGMVLAENLKTKTNLLLVSKHQEVSDTLRMCILNFAAKKNIVEPIRILEKRPRA